MSFESNSYFTAPVIKLPDRSSQLQVGPSSILESHIDVKRLAEDWASRLNDIARDLEVRGAKAIPDCVGDLFDLRADVMINLHL